MSLKCATNAPDHTPHLKNGANISFGREGHVEASRGQMVSRSMETTQILQHMRVWCQIKQGWTMSL